MIVTGPLDKTRQENPMKSGNLVLALLAMSTFSDVMAQQLAVGPEETRMRYFCGYGKLGNIATFVDNESPSVSFVTEYTPLLQYNPGAFARSAVSMGFGIALAGINKDKPFQEHFYRKQEFLSQARQAGLAVKIMAWGSADGSNNRYCAAKAENMNIKLCRETSDCCSDYSECGKEGNTLRFKIVPAIPEAFYE